MGVIIDGYYYPNPEEIFIGYRCEVNWSRGYEETYTPFSVRIKEENGAYTNDHHELTIAMDDGYAGVRVPLLSKEDIESLGWLDLQFSAQEDFPIYGLGGYYLIFGKDSISIQKLGGANLLPVYNGSCPTINELRYLMRLLKIVNDGKRDDSNVSM